MFENRIIVESKLDIDLFCMECILQENMDNGVDQSRSLFLICCQLRKSFRFFVLIKKLSFFARIKNPFFSEFLQLQSPQLRGTLAEFEHAYPAKSFLLCQKFIDRFQLKKEYFKEKRNWSKPKYEKRHTEWLILALITRQLKEVLFCITSYTRDRCQFSKQESINPFLGNVYL